MPSRTSLARAFPAGVAQNGALQLTEADRRGLDMHLLTLVGQRVYLEVGPEPTTRSQRANRYYWSTVLEIIAREQEMTPYDVHDAMCAKFLPNEPKRVEFFNRMTGETMPVECDGRRSSKLSGHRFYEFVERVRLYALEELGVETPDPDPAYWRKRSSPA